MGRATDGQQGRTARAVRRGVVASSRDMPHARPLLVVRRSGSAPRRAERVAWCVLALLACLVAHEAAYRLMYPGVGPYRTAMTLLGHDGYWVGLAVSAVVATGVLIAVAVAQLRRLQREAATTPAFAADERVGARAYLALVAGTWLRLALLAILAFIAQENLEALGAAQPVRGLAVILGHGLLPLVVILAATLPMALAVALVRWRRRVLIGRLARVAHTWSRQVSRHARSGASPSLDGRTPAGTWASRAPPRRAAPIAP